jgi:redox-sensitive bicupin YhaK (pirin superfamily)
VHGPITRLISPSDLGEIVKPFVFLDLFENEGQNFDGFGLHPHSGIATLTYIAEGSVNYEDTNGARGLSAITPIRSCSLGLRKS